jgi:predicted ATPase
LGVGELLGRDSEIEKIASAIADTRDGRGSLLLLEGPAGIGKTALTRAAIEVARREGLTPLAARGNEGETDLPYGVVRQLLEPPLVHDADRRTRILTGSAQLATPILFLEPGTGTEGTGKPEPMAMLHGLFWVCSNLGEEGPLLLVADDLHWADPPSMRFVTYLANRIADLPVVLVAAYRTGEPIDRVALDAIAALPVTTVISPQALSPDDSASLVEAAYDMPPAPEFAGACHEASGGNPFLLGQLLKSLVAERAEPSADSAQRVAEATPAEVLRSVGARLRRLPPHSQSLAEALAVAGEQSPTIHVATLMPEVAGGPSPYAPGQGIPSHLRAGIYQDPNYSCPTGCSVDIDNVQVFSQ